MAKRTVVIAWTSDQHCGSTVGLCPPKVRLPEGGNYEESKPQAWMWERWIDFWGKVERIRRREKAILYCGYNGDLYEGDHHGTKQIVSRDSHVQSYIADTVFNVPRKLKPKYQFVVRGTECHVGSAEEDRAAWMKAQKDPVTGNWSHWHLRQEINGVRFDVKHHGRIGTRPWTRSNPVSMLAFNIWAEHAERELPYPHVAIRSHFHTSADSGDAYKTRVIQLPAWQLKTAHAHKVVAENIADIGGVIIIVPPDGEYEIKRVLYPVELPPMWRAHG